MTPDLPRAQAFLTALDEASGSWCFQTFSDDGSQDKRLIRTLHGDLGDHGGELAQLNLRGAGIFVTVNETDGHARRKTNIRRIRALYVDLDGAPLEPVLSAHAPPNIVVESSPSRFHAYWRVDDCPVDACEPALKQIIRRYGGDPACSDRNRVLRLPGFFHRKADPFQVQVIHSLPGEYTLADLEISTDLQKIQKIQKNQQSSSGSSVSSVGEWIYRYLPDSRGLRNRCLFGLARYLKGTMPNATRTKLRGFVEEWHRLARPVIGTAEFSESWGDFMRGWDAVHTPYGSVMNSIMETIEMTIEIPESIAALGYQEKGYLLIRICKQLQQRAGNEPFFLSARQAGELIGMHFTDASKVLYGLVVDGVLELVKRGSGKAASRYRYVWETAPGGACSQPEGAA